MKPAAPVISFAKYRLERLGRTDQIDVAMIQSRVVLSLKFVVVTQYLDQMAANIPHSRLSVRAFTVTQEGPPHDPG